MTIKRDGFLGRVKNLVKLGKESFDIGRERATIGDIGLAMETEQIGEVDGFVILKNHKIMKARGSIIAIAMVTECGEKFVMVDDIFDTLDENTKQFIIQHEVGHLMDENLNLDMDMEEKDKERVKYAKRGEVYPEELFADNYAVSKVGYRNAIKAIEQLQTVVNNYHVFKKDKEFELRINSIISNNTGLKEEELLESVSVALSNIKRIL